MISFLGEEDLCRESDTSLSFDLDLQFVSQCQPER